MLRKKYVKFYVEFLGPLNVIRMTFDNVNQALEFYSFLVDLGVTIVATNIEEK